MKLYRLDEEIFSQIKTKPIYLAGYSVSYMEELCDAYDILGSIRGILDNAARSHGSHEFRGHVLNVEGLDTMSKLPRDAVIVITDDYFKEMFDAVCKGTEVREVYFFPNKETAYDLDYREKYKDTPLEDIILFRSGPHASGYVKGMDFGDNARALFEYALKAGLNRRYELVWIVKEPAEYEEKFQGEAGVRFLPFSGSVSEDAQIRDEYYRMLCLAKIIFFTDAYGFARNAREDQIRVQLWHGCGFKTRVNFSSCEKRYEYMTVTSDYYAEIYSKSFGLRADQMLVTGYPKGDYLFHPAERWKERFSVPDAEKYIFWLPTFRTVGAEGLENLNETCPAGTTGLPVMASSEEMALLNQCLKEEKIVLLIKLHPFQNRELIAEWDLSNIVILENEQFIEEDVQTNELLGCADALISDYSSAAIDYLVLDRPIAFTLDDYEEYGESRGFNWPNVRDYLPGVEIFTFEDFVAFVRDVSQGVDAGAEKRQRLKALFQRYCDDGNAERVFRGLGICLNNL